MKIILSAVMLIMSSCVHVVSDLHEDYSDLSKRSKFQVIREIDALFNHDYFQHAHWGILIQSLDDGKIWYEHQADKMFIPASNNKIVTTAAALMSLGPDYRFENLVLGRGELADSTFQGDIILKSNGDPTLYSQFFDHPRSEFFRWADSLKALGIRRVRGDIIADATAFDDEIYGYGWSWDNFNYYYSSEISALQLNENYIDVQIIAPDDSSGDIELIPSCLSDYYELINEITLIDSGESRIRFDRRTGSNNITLYGQLRYSSDTVEVAPTIHDPAAFYAFVFLEVLEESGIDVMGSVQTLKLPHFPFEQKEDSITASFPVDTLLMSLSPAFPKILAKLMKRSQNLYAETMVKTMGNELKGFGSFDSGRVAVEESLEKMGIPPETYRYMDGSGLSRYNFVSPRMIIGILSYMDQSSYSRIWHEIQAVAGVDGTLRSRMKGTRAQGNVHGKTGTLSNVRGMSGYVTTADGERLVFSFLINGHLRSSRETNLVTDRVLTLLANLKRPLH